MHTRPFFIPLLLFGGIALTIQSCTSYMPAKLIVNRPNDTLAVAINSLGAARWDPQKDSLVLECPGCNPSQSRIVERFEERNSALFGIPPSEVVTLTLYTLGRRDTTITLPAVGTWDTSSPSPGFNQLESRRSRSSNPSNGPSHAESRKEKQPEKVAKAPTRLKVTAPEGVAIYKDKTKKEVLKIVAQGTILSLLAREGDLYSVGVDDGEGFVEAEAVHILE